MILGMFFKKTIWEDNRDFYSEQSHSIAKLLLRIIIYIIMILPAGLLVAVHIKIAWLDLVFAFVLGIIFAFNFLFF